MTQGRKCRTVLGLGCALVALVAGTVMAPAMASAQADQEYNLQIPGAGGGKNQGGGPTATAPDTDGGGGAPIVLIGLAAVAAGCAGVAAWRLRNRDQPTTEGRSDPRASGWTGNRRSRSHLQVTIGA